MTPTHYHETKKQLIFGIVLNAVFSVIEFFGGLFANSLALLSDAAHDLTDTVALSLSLFANYRAQKAPTSKRTFGFHRSTILAALLNSVLLIILTLFIFHRAYLRLFNPEPVKGLFLFIIAIFGIVFNGVIVLRMWKGRKEDINLRSAFWHMMEDALGWTGVLVAGIVIMLTGWYLIDPIISFFIGLIVLRGAFGIVKEATDVLMEGVPKHIKLESVSEEIKKVSKVEDVHDLHVWSIGSNYYALSCHVLVPDMKVGETNNIRERINRVLREKFNITHTTVEFECSNCDELRQCN